VKKIIPIVLAAAFPALSSAGQWSEYPITLPTRYETIRAMAVNYAGIGYATVGGQYEFNGPLLKLENGEWQPLEPPPVDMAYLSITPEGTLYAIDNYGSGNVWRYSSAGRHWNCVLTPGAAGLVKFKRVAGVGPDEFWALGSSPDAHAIVAYYRDGGVARLYDLGRYRTDPHLSTLGHIVAPRVENPGAEAYVAFQMNENEMWPSKWVLAVLKPEGGYSFYPIPRGEGYHVEGFVAYRPGEVRLGMVKNGAAGPTYIYAFENGRFREIAYYAERVVLRCYVTPSDGWGTSYTNKVYHWTTAGPGEFYILSAVVKDVGMVNVNDGWAGGYERLPGGVTKAIMWHYTDNPAVTPTSLGRVKAVFR
jgi:hypothetical protein